MLVHQSPEARSARGSCSGSVLCTAKAGWDGPTGSEQPTIGQAVTVYYDPSDPNTSALVDFRELALRSAGPVPFAIGGSGLVVLFILTRRHLMAVRK